MLRAHGGSAFTILGLGAERGRIRCNIGRACESLEVVTYMKWHMVQVSDRVFVVIDAHIPR